ncbi:alcohol dehydrogenase [Nocardia amikacinitolerans]|nr:alcohol dehydrogenase [Nocardia amikacinitolerans]
MSVPLDAVPGSVAAMKIRGAVLERIAAPVPFAESAPINVCELELGEPGPGELLVRIEAAGLCHSDLSVVDGNRVRPVPMLLGHEAAGRVEAVGPGDGDIAVGQRVVMTFLPRCGGCAGCASEGRTPCVPGSAANNAGELLNGGRRLRREGAEVHHHLGVSAFATHAVVDRRSVVPVDDDVPPEVAAVLGCAVLTGGGALLNSARPGPADRIMVVGLGGVGMAAVLVAVSLGAKDVIAVDTVPEKLDLAKDLGATAAYTPAEVAEQGVQAEVVIEAAGNVRAFETAVAATAAGGTTVTVGLPAPEARASISPLALVAQGRSIVGSYLGSAVPSRDIPEYVRMWREGRLPVERLVSAHIGLDEINRAMDELAAGHALRQVIVFD